MDAVVNEDLQKERKKCNFFIEELTNLLDNGKKNTQERRLLEKNVLSTKELFDDVPDEYLSYADRFTNSIRKSVLLYRTLEAVEDRNKTYEEKYLLRIRSSVLGAVFKEHPPFNLHLAMFVPGITSLADDKQKQVWLNRALNMEIIGAYAQTELGHGTFVRGLETRATYDVETEEFVLHSPTLSAYKWWPGGLGQASNYCIVMANLFIKDKNHGVQPFLVQIRDEDTHMPLPGIKVGDIGVKLGYNTVNNGFLGFDHHRIPRDRMLMKNAQVLKDGTFTSSTNSKLVYSAMVNSRVYIIITSAIYLAKAATISIRYSAVRRQSQIKPNEPEVQVIDFVTQQHKLFIGIATSYAYLLTGYCFLDLYKKYNEEFEAGNLEHLPELHALSCALKVVSSSDCSELIEQCRRSCGGHGYMMSSNLPQLYSNCTASCTYEGENTVLMLQAARSLIKTWDRVSKGERISNSVAYLADKTPTPNWELSVDGIIRSLQRISIGKLSTSATTLQRYISAGLSPENAWNKASVQLIAAAEAHARVVVLLTFKSEVERRSPGLSASSRRVLKSLVELYAVYWALQRAGDLLLYTKLSQKDIYELQKQYEDLLETIRPNAVGLVDAFDFRDKALNSTLGSYDGRAYERLMEEAMKSPLNQQPVDESFHKYLKPFMRGKL